MTPKGTTLLNSRSRRLQGPGRVGSLRIVCKQRLVFPSNPTASNRQQPDPDRAVRAATRGGKVQLLLALQSEITNVRNSLAALNRLHSPAVAETDLSEIA